jgi:hypothetical protein
MNMDCSDRLPVRAPFDCRVRDAFGNLDRSCAGDLRGADDCVCRPPEVIAFPDIESLHSVKQKCENP